MNRTLWKDLFRKTGIFFVIYLAAWLVPLYVALPHKAGTTLHWVAVIAFFIQVGLWMNVAVTYSMRHYLGRHGTHDPSAVTTINAVSILIKIVLWVLLLLLALDNLDIQIKALVTGLGIGGVAIALATQNILGDLFAAIAIVTDKPFVIGDSISVDDYRGKVEHIGLKTTRIRSETGEQIIFSNNELLKSKIRNYSR